LRLVLASTSPWRLKVLHDAGIRAEPCAPGVDESSDEPDPVARARGLARRKAAAVRDRFPDALVLGADQVVTDGRDIWGKPRDPGDHAARLRAMRGRSHDLVTGWALLGPAAARGGHASTRLWARADVDDAEIDAYVATGEGTGCAGGYAIEGRGVFLFERIEGDWFNVMGLPLLPVLGALRELGWRFGTT
jgi:septum formation protein